ncbi:uncharacterized protein [Prorops nasuta]|uniref:uncharacterized protein n=1 Tax=Prorops nasuta TaxID=863751 RepID=UPI0034CEB02F
MQRVLTFQMARGFGESSEFVTKRMCFSFLFSVGFLCLLCGFLLGRFASQRAIEFRAEKKRLELAGNGLESTEYIRQLLLGELRKSFKTLKLDPSGSPEDVKNDLAKLSVFGKIIDNKSCFLASIAGSRESDRYVILSVSGNSISIALRLAKILNKIYSNEEWSPRRTIIFCFNFGSADVCPNILPLHVRSKTVAYIYLDHYEGSRRVFTSGSDILQSIVLDIFKESPYFNQDGKTSYNISKWFYSTDYPRLMLDVPHIVFSPDENITLEDHNARTDPQIIADIIMQTLWRLSESLILQWNPNHFNQTLNIILEPLDSRFQIIKEIKDVVTDLVKQVRILNMKMKSIESTRSLQLRIWNDLLMDLDKILLCPNDSMKSKTDLTILRNANSTNIAAYLQEMLHCYQGAMVFLQS